MGFDIECIIDIHNHPGEYFCPVCRTLVYPNEALQSQCTHVFCKPCLSHVTNTTRTCPYDGYLVTQADSKPLIQSDKAYAETTGKVKVRWEGSLAECTSHCLGCSFGHSQVICNRWGIQIVHRQVHEHAQSCPGAYQQPGPEGGQAVPSSGATTATGDLNLNGVFNLRYPNRSALLRTEPFHLDWNGYLIQNKDSFGFCSGQFRI